MSLIQPKARALISTRHSAELLDTEAHGFVLAVWFRIENTPSTTASLSNMGGSNPKGFEAHWCPLFDKPSAPIAWTSQHPTHQSVTAYTTAVGRSTYR